MSETTKPESTEKVRKIYAKDVRDKSHLLTVFRVEKKQKHARRNGKEFVAVTLVDRTGELDARIFDHLDKLEPGFAVSDYVLVSGNVQTYQSRPQLVIESIERLDPTPIDAREFTPPAPPPEEKTKSIQGITEMVERVQDAHIKKLLLACLSDPRVANGLPHAPAAKGIHHAYKGGLADHLFSVMKLAHRVADHYPMADRDLLVAGALLHDLGKVTELTYGHNQGTDYSDEGRLVGHLVMTAQWIHEKARQIEGFPKALELHLTHLVVAHHGRLEYGSPKTPATLEALLVHLIDMMDSQVASWLEHMARDPHDRWAEPSRFIDRHLWKGPVPTSRHKAPVEPRPRKEHKRKPRGEHTPKPAVEAKTESSPKAAAEPIQRDPSLPKELAFKPFSILTQETEEKPS